MPTQLFSPLVFTLVLLALVPEVHALTPKTSVQGGYFIYTLPGNKVASKKKGEAGRGLASVTSKATLFQRIVTEDEIGVNFYIFCSDRALKSCASIAYSNDYLVSQFEEIVSLMGRFVNFDGKVGTATLDSLISRFRLAKVKKLYRPEYYDISGSLEDTIFPPSDSTLEAAKNSVNVYVVNSAPYCGMAYVNQYWKTPRGSLMTMHGGCLSTQKAETIPSSTTTAKTRIFGDTSFAHEVMHAMGPGHTADYWGNFETYSGCGKSHSWKSRLVTPEQGVSVGHNIMSYDALHTVGGDDTNGNGILEYRDGASFKYETLSRPDSTTFPASRLMADARNCYLRKQ